jgi:hypothetical protein
MALLLVKMDDIVCSFAICLRFAPGIVRHLAMAGLAFYPLHPEPVSDRSLFQMRHPVVGCRLNKQPEFLTEL